MKHTLPIFILIPSMLLFSSCETTSISNVGRNPFYRGELAETDFLGIPSGRTISDESIRAALARSSDGPVRLRASDHILLIQSGALQPDAAMSAAFQRHVRVSPCSGLPQEQRGGHTVRETAPVPRSDPKALRYAAAQAGANKIVCVWGMLESASDPTVLESVSWLPVVGEFIPDRHTVTRLTLKGMVMDTATGAWHSYTAEPVTDKRTTVRFTNALHSARQTETIKASAYMKLAECMAGITRQ